MMDIRKTIPVIVFLCGIFLVIYGAFSGEVGLAILLFIPVIYGSGIFLIGGILLIFLAFLLYFFFSFQQVTWKGGEVISSERSSEESSYGGVIFIGPIPIVFGKDKSITTKMMYLGLLIASILAAIYVATILT